MFACLANQRRRYFCIGEVMAEYLVMVSAEAP